MKNVTQIKQKAVENEKDPALLALEIIKTLKNRIDEAHREAEKLIGSA